MVPDALPALFHSRAGIVASGTATVEAAMMNTPFVMVYRVSPLTYMLGKPRVKIPRFAMVNLIAGEEVVPELVQHDFTAAKVASCTETILADGPARQRMLEGLARVRTKLGWNHERQSDHAPGRSRCPNHSDSQARRTHLYHYGSNSKRPRPSFIVD